MENEDEGTGHAVAIIGFILGVGIVVGLLYWAVRQRTVTSPYPPSNPDVRLGNPAYQPGRDSRTYTNSTGGSP